MGSVIGLIKGDARGLDYSSFATMSTISTLLPEIINFAQSPNLQTQNLKLEAVNKAGNYAHAPTLTWRVMGQRNHV